jgi:hypothetical protein
VSKLSLSLEHLEVASFEPAPAIKSAVADDGTYDTVGVFCTYPKYSCLLACQSV